MDKKDWEEGLKRLEAILTDAEDTYQKSIKDIKELKFTILNYKRKIRKMKD